MPTIKPAKAPKNGGSTQAILAGAARSPNSKCIRRSAALKPAKAGASGAEIAEIAICLALGEMTSGDSGLRGAGRAHRAQRQAQIVQPQLAKRTGGIGDRTLRRWRRCSAIQRRPRWSAPGNSTTRRRTGGLSQRLQLCGAAQTSDPVSGGEHPDTGARAGVGSAHALHRIWHSGFQRGCQRCDCGLPGRHRSAAQCAPPARPLRDRSADRDRQEARAARQAPSNCSASYMERHGNWPL